MTVTGKSRSAPVAILAAVLLLLFTAVTAVAAEQTAMRFDRLSIKEGLSQSAVTAIAQDETGFMWFATENGLDRYDGYSFRNYRRQRGSTDGLANDFARDINVDAEGNLWVATDGGGVSRFDPTTNKFTSWRHDPQDAGSLASDRVRKVLADPRGYVWIATRDSGLDKLDVATGEISHFEHSADEPGSISNNEILALVVADDGFLWIGTRSGLNRLDPQTRQVTRFVNNPDDPSSLPDNHVRSLLVDHEGTLWVGTSRAGLVSFSPDSGAFRQFAHDGDDHHSISSNRIEAIFEDNQQRLWVGTDAGLNLLDRDKGEFDRYANDPTDPSSLSSNFVFTIFQDRAGILWVGTRTGGINKWNPRSWSFGFFKPSTGANSAFSNPNVTAFTEDAAGQLWVGTFGGGLNIMDRSKDVITQIRTSSGDGASISDDRVMALLTDANGQIWAGTMTGGLNRIDPLTGAVTTFRHDPDDPTSLAADGVMAVIQDRYGSIWVGTFGGGVSRLEPGADKFTNYPHDPANEKTLSGPRATSIAEDGNGVIWVGTDGGGLNRFDRSSEEWQRFTHNPNDPGSLNSNTVYALHSGAGGTLWIGTRAGLARLTETGVAPAVARFGDVGSRDGLSSDPVYSIESDLNGDIWLSGARGLTRYSPGSGNVRSFHESQGLQGEEFNFGASYSSSAGELFFGGSNGFNAFVPSSLEFSRQPPPVVLTSLSVLNESVETETPHELIENFDLGYKDDVVTFVVAALDFSAPAENHYAYQLDGFDDAWVDAGTERRITYTNLDGGNYTLRVRAANGDGYWNDEGVAIAINVAYPPWKTWWAYALYVLAAVTLILTMARRQQQKLQREAEYSRRLEQEVRQRTDELKRRNSDLKEVNEKLQQASTTDPLTGLRNRRYLFEQITKDVDLVLRHYRDGTETMKPGGNNDLLFLMVDLDNFKPVNDSCGHEAGDELLLQIRDVLLEACRFSDDVIRWGGDEFLIVARDTNRSYAPTLAERIRSGLASSVFPIGNGQVARSTASIGYASFPFLKDQPEILEWEEVLGVADAAMYEAKEKRNAWVGIEGIDWDGTGEELYSAIKFNPGKLAEEGLIRAVESLDDVEQDVG